MQHLGWTSCITDRGVCYKAQTRPSGGHEYYVYALCYIYDILAVHHDGMEALRGIDKFFKMKKGSVGDPDYYLGAKLKKMKLANGVEAWGMSSSKYANAVVANVVTHLESKGQGHMLSKRAPTPFKGGYQPEMDASPELNPKDATYYQSQIGILRWMCDLGRIDIIMEVSMLELHPALPREGHLEAVCHIFEYLRAKNNARMCFDPTYPEIDMGAFKECDWKTFCGDVKEAVPPNAPKARGK